MSGDGLSLTLILSFLEQSESELQAGVALPMEHPHIRLWGGNDELWPLQS